MKYFKKSKMYRMAKDLLPNVKLPAMAECTYEAYEGSEWLKFKTDLKKYDLYHEANRVTLKCIDYNGEEARKILHRSFCLNTEGGLTKIYEEQHPALTPRM